MNTWRFATSGGVVRNGLVLGGGRRLLVGCGFGRDRERRRSANRGTAAHHLSPPHDRGSARTSGQRNEQSRAVAIRRCSRRDAESVRGTGPPTRRRPRMNRNRSFEQRSPDSRRYLAHESPRCGWRTASTPDLVPNDVRELALHRIRRMPGSGRLRSTDTLGSTNGPHGGHLKVMSGGK